MLINEQGILRLILCYFFSMLYVVSLYHSIYVVGFELESDFLNYFIFYSEPGFNIGRWGAEIMTPLLFGFGGALGFSYFDFIFLIGLSWLLPIYLLSKTIKTEYLLFFYVFFVLWLSPQYAFLFRHYLAVFFAVLFFCVNVRYRSIFMILALLSHFAIFFVFFFSYIRFKRNYFYFALSLLAVGLFISYGFGFSFLSLFDGIVLHAGIDELDRKLNTFNAGYEYHSGSYAVYLVLCVAVLLHTFKIDSSAEFFSLERAFYFSALCSLILSEFVIFSNRVGMLAYFFSIPYLLMVVSRYNIVWMPRSKLSSNVSVEE